MSDPDPIIEANDDTEILRDDTDDENDCSDNDICDFDPHQYVPDRIDYITADGIEQVHEHLSDENAAEYAEASVEQQAMFLWKMVDRGVVDLEIGGRELR